MAFLKLTTASNAHPIILSFAGIASIRPHTTGDGCVVRFLDSQENSTGVRVIESMDDIQSKLSKMDAIK